MNQQQQTTFTEILNFDEASRAWRENKKKVGQFFLYKCSHANCKRNALQLPLLKEFICKWHSGIYYKNSLKGAKYNL